MTGPPPPMAGWLAPNKGGRPLAPLLALALATIAPAADADTETASYVGSQACAPCHAEAFTAWSGSDHAWAMRPASDATVKGDFGDVTVEHLGSRARFFRRDGRFWVETDGADGAPAEFEVTYTFGITPLQQYLVALDGGRLQALPFAWDTRPAAAGGQRWFHLHPDEFIGAADPLHWTGLFYNWNASCAACHATDLVEGYDLASNRFATSWAELDVGCEACHGPGSAHLAWAESAPAGAAPTGSLGLTTRLAESAEGHWAFEGDDPIASWQGPPRPGAEIEVCAPCHARRRPLVEGPQPGTPFLDAYAPALLEERLYHPDGQILDEVYVWGSFVQSRMHRAGVTCSDCHQPHDLTLHAPGNAVCGQCHRPDVFDDPAHHHHEAGTAGAQCVECHMPATTYMVVDPRRDHGFRVPRPDLSVRLGVPNPCTGCHTDRTDAWAAAAIEDWYGAERPRPPGFAVALDAARKGLPEAAALLAEVATDPDQPAIARATALSHLPDHLGPDVLGAYQAGLDDPDPLVRAAAVRALAPFPPEQRLAAAGPLLDDPVRLVRVEAGRLLAAVPPERVPAALRDPLARAIEEYVASQRAVAERPEAHLNLGVLAAEQGRLDGAEQELRQALALDPAFVPAHVNLADLYRARGREDLAEGQLREAIRDDPEAAAAHYALGLLLVRTGRRGAAVEELGRAAALDPDAARYAYAHALALHGEGRTDAALEVLEAAHERHPADREILFALVTINRDRGAPSRARLFLRRLMDLAPDDPGVRQLARGLGIAP